MTPATSQTANAVANRPKIGLVSAVIFVISAVIGTGVFKKVVPMSAELGSPTLVLAAWLLAGLVSLAGTLSTAEGASMLASDGGEYAYFRTIFNRSCELLFGGDQFAGVITPSLAPVCLVFSRAVYNPGPFAPPSALRAQISVPRLPPPGKPVG